MEYSFERDEFYLSGMDQGPSELDELSDAVAAEPANGELRFVLANYLLRTGELSDAVEIYRRAAILLPEDDRLRTNLGLALAGLGRTDDAIAAFEAVITRSPSLELPYLHLGRLLAARGQSDRALEQFEMLINFAQQQSTFRRRAKFETAKILFHRGQLDDSALLLEEVLDREPQLAAARSLYTRIVFMRGRGPFLTGDVESAFQIWGEGAGRFSLSFSSDDSVQSEFSGLVRAFNESRVMIEALRIFRASYREGRRGVPVFYPLVVRFCFSAGLLPEAYENRLHLDRSEARWRDSLTREGEHPYPHFKIGMIFAYRGEIDQALSELMLFRDRLPPKRHPVFRLKEVLQFLTRVKELTTELDSRTGVTATEEDWERWGFGDNFERRSWQRTGIMPDEAAAWRSRNFSAKQALQWRRNEVSIEDAAVWREGGFETAKSARQWLRAKVPPRTAKLWSVQFADDTERAVQAIKAGFDDPVAAAEWLQYFMFPWEARPWLDGGFTALDAEAWVRAGFNDAVYAKRWRDAGFEPMDARLEIQSGKSEPPKCE